MSAASEQLLASEGKEGTAIALASTGEQHNRSWQSLRPPSFDSSTTARSWSLGSSNNGPQLAVRYPERFTLAVMGRSGVGKSAITVRYTRDRFLQEYDPTIEDLHIKNTTIQGSPACVEILDTAGQEAYSALRRSWMQHGSGFLFVFSLVDRQTFDELRAFYDELMDLYNNDPPPSVLVANKADIDAGEWVVCEEEVRSLKASWRNCAEVVYTSAKSSCSVADAFDSLCLAVRERTRRRREARERESARRESAAASAGAASRSSHGGSGPPNAVVATACRRCRLSQCAVTMVAAMRRVVG